MRSALFKGQDRIDKHLDIRNLMKKSFDMKILKDLLLRPQQKILFNNQAYRFVDLDNSSDAAISYSSSDEFEKNSQELMKLKFETEMDRKLLLGVIDRKTDLTIQPLTTNRATPNDVSINEVQYNPRESFVERRATGTGQIISDFYGNDLDDFTPVKK